MWRNDVDSSQIDLGIGFYGRSFNLTDPKCFQPGCHFQSGAAKGVCSGESGILTYDEITNIIAQYDVDPIWDKVYCCKSAKAFGVQILIQELDKAMLPVQLVPQLTD